MNKKEIKVLAVIPARGGSKGLIRKNILDLAGLPLIAWTIKAAKESQIISNVILSSDDDEIIEVAKRFDCEVPFKRPSHLATDNATSVDVLAHAIKDYSSYDFVIMLQPTSPLRTSIDIDAAFELMTSLNAKSCVSVCQTSKTPYWMYSLSNDGVLENLTASNYRVSIVDNSGCTGSTIVTVTQPAEININYDLGEKSTPIIRIVGTFVLPSFIIGLWIIYRGTPEGCWGLGQPNTSYRVCYHQPNCI